MVLRRLCPVVLLLVACGEETTVEPPPPPEKELLTVAEGEPTPAVETEFIGATLPANATAVGSLANQVIVGTTVGAHAGLFVPGSQGAAGSIDTLALGPGLSALCSGCRSPESMMPSLTSAAVSPRTVSLRPRPPCC